MPDHQDLGLDGSQLRWTSLHNDVPVVWADYPGRLRARLTFRVGQSDERLVTRGITHLSEHLALSNTDHDITANGCVEGRFTAFDVAGSDEDVVSHLAHLTRNLHALPEERFAHERQVLRLESEGRSDAADGLRQRRFGLRGPGLQGCAELGLHRVTLAEVQAWSAQVFTAGNAVLWLSGPPPPGLDLALPAESRRVEQPLAAHRVTAPAWFQAADPFIAFSVLSERGPASAAARWWLHRQLRQRLRTGSGRVYSVAMAHEAVSVDQTETIMVLDAGRYTDEVLLEETLDVLSEVRTGRVTDQELTLWQRSVRYAAEEPDAVLGQLDDASRRLLEGRTGRSMADRFRAVHAVTTEEVQQALTAALGTLLLQSPYEVDPRHQIPPVPEREPQALVPERVYVPGREHRGGHRLLVSPHGVSLEDAGAEQPATLFWSECEAVLRLSDGQIVLVSEDGSILEVDPQDWREGKELSRRLAAYAPAEVVVELDADRSGTSRSTPSLSGLAAVSTGPLVVLLLGVAVLTVLMLTTTLDPEPGAGRGGLLLGSALLLAFDAALVLALARRLKAPREARRSFETRARTGAALAVDGSLARASMPMLKAATFASWGLVVLMLVFWGTPSTWPCIFVSAFALRPSLEWNRRTRRAALAQAALGRR